MATLSSGLKVVQDGVNITEPGDLHLDMLEQAWTARIIFPTPPKNNSAPLATRPFLHGLCSPLDHT